MIGKHAFLLPQIDSQDEKEDSITEGFMEQWTGEESSQKTYYGSDACEMGIKEEKVQEELATSYSSSSENATVETMIPLNAEHLVGNYLPN